MAELLLVASIAGRRVGFRAAEVHSVIELDAIAPIPCTSAHIAGLSALRSRVLTVIDCRCSLELSPLTHHAEKATAAVVEFEGHLYALLVETATDVLEARSECSPLRAALGDGWDRAALGTIETDSGPLLLLGVDGLIAGPPPATNAKAA